MLPCFFLAVLAGLTLVWGISSDSWARPEDEQAFLPSVSTSTEEIPLSALTSEKLPSVNVCPTVKTLGENVSGIALEQLGVHYHRGGSSPRSGFDCSGFVYWVFARHGVRVPRDSVRQSSAGHKVEKKDLLPGDILIFRIPRTPNGRHSAIYIGKGRFIHSPTSGSRVRLEKLNDSYWQKHYHTARRILKAPPCNLDIYASSDYGNTRRLTDEISSE